MSPLDLIEVNIALGVVGCVLFYGALRMIVYVLESL